MNEYELMWKRLHDLLNRKVKEYNIEDLYIDAVIDIQHEMQLLEEECDSE